MVFQGDLLAIIGSWFRRVDKPSRESLGNFDIGFFFFGKVLLRHIFQNDRVQVCQNVYTQAKVATALQLFQIRSTDQPTSTIHNIDEDDFASITNMVVSDL